MPNPRSSIDTHAVNIIHKNKYLLAYFRLTYRTSERKIYLTFDFNQTFEFDDQSNFTCQQCDGTNQPEQ